MSLYEEKSCNESLLEVLEDQGGFQIFTPKKRMEPGEGLTKIWMCPSSEMATALFSTKPVQLMRENEGSLNIIDKFTGEKKQGKEGSGSETGSVKDLETYYNESSSDESSKSFMAIELEDETSLSSTSSFPDERVDHMKQSLKQMYKEKFSQGAELILSYSRKMLDNELYKLTTEFREQEEEKITKALKPIVDFIERHRTAVNRENGYFLKKKYHKLRRECTTRLIDAAEENFTYLCIKIEKELHEVYLFNVEQMINKYRTDYSERRRSEIDKWVKKFKDERETIRNDHEKAMADTKDKYRLMFDELQLNEQNRVDEEIERIKERMIKPIQEKSPPDDPFKKRAEDSGWLCVLNQLLTDMQQFVRCYISSKQDLKNLLGSIMTHKPFGELLKVKTQSFYTVPVVDDAALKPKEPSVDSIPCIKDRDELLHRNLVQEAGAILEKILSDLSQGRVGKALLDTKPKLDHTDSSFLHFFAPPSKFQSDSDCSRYNFSIYSDSEETSNSRSISSS